MKVIDYIEDGREYIVSVRTDAGIVYVVRVGVLDAEIIYRAVKRQQELTEEKHRLLAEVNNVLERIEE